MPFLDDLGSSSFPRKTSIVGNERIPIFDTYEAGNSPVKYVLASDLSGGGGPVDLTSDVTGTLPVANGGTGGTTFTNNRLLTGNGTSGIVDEANLTFDGSTLTVSGASTTSGVVSITNATNSTTNTTGALVVTGGIGCGGSIKADNSSCLFGNVTVGPTAFYGMSGRALMQAGTSPTRMFFTDSGFSNRIPIDSAGLIMTKTMTAGGTTGAQTINQYAGSVNFAAAATSLVVTNSLVTANSIVIATVQTNDSTMKSVLAVPTAGSFTLHANAAATAETKVAFVVIN